MTKIKYPLAFALAFLSTSLWTDDFLARPARLGTGGGVGELQRNQHNAFNSNPINNFTSVRHIRLILFMDALLLLTLPPPRPRLHTRPPDPTAILPLPGNINPNP